MLVGTVLTEIEFYFYFITPGSLRDVVITFRIWTDIIYNYDLLLGEYIGYFLPV